MESTITTTTLPGIPTPTSLTPELDEGRALVLRQEADACAELLPELTYPNGFKITTPEQADSIAAVRETAKERYDRIVEFFKKPKSQAHGIHKFLCGLETAALTQPAAIAQRATKLLEGWAGHLREEKQRIERESAEREAAERKRIEDAAVERAAVREASGDAAGAALEIEVAILTPTAATAAPPPPPPASIRTSVKWAYEVLDATKLKERYKIPDHESIKNRVSTLGPEAHELVGEGALRIYEVDKIASRPRGRG